MNKLLVIYACALFGSAPVAEPQESTAPLLQTSTKMARTLESRILAFNYSADRRNEMSYDKAVPRVEASAELDLSTVVFIEEENLDLGFDTADYLPEGFDPNEVYFDLSAVPYVEESTAVELGFDTSTYLPEGFDPYSDNFDVDSINYIEDEEIELGFDTKDYLPEGFNPYEVYFDVSTVEFIEDEDEIDLGFDTSKYLPEGFDPYAAPSSVDSINYMELDELNL